MLVNFLTIKPIRILNSIYIKIFDFSVKQENYIKLTIYYLFINCAFSINFFHNQSFMPYPLIMVVPVNTAPTIYNFKHIY